MKAKIRWYQEVLELEPSSKVFFPLAKLFAENGQYAEAVASLRQGLERHPEHFEARMLLIDCLGNLGAQDQLVAEVRAIGSVLQQHPLFWQRWASSLTDVPQQKDAALALSFLSASFSERGVSWTAVIEAGLRNVLAHAGTPTATSRAPRTGTPEISAMATEPDDEVVEDDLVHPAPGREGGQDDTGSRGAVPRSHARIADEEHPVRLPQHTSEEHGDEDDDAEAEPFSLRTFSMAQVLAEQGDVKGALEICDELETAELTATERSRIQEFRKMLLSPKAAVAEGDSTASGTAGALPLQGKNKLILTLESLAERLEARAARP